MARCKRPQRFAEFCAEQSELRSERVQPRSRLLGSVKVGSLAGSLKFVVEYCRSERSEDSRHSVVTQIGLGGVFDMHVLLRAAGWGGSLLVIIALIITLLKQLIAFIGFITFAVKILIILAFAAVIIAVGLMVLKGFKNSRKHKE